MTLKFGNVRVIAGPANGGLCGRDREGTAWWLDRPAAARQRVHDRLPATLRADGTLAPSVIILARALRAGVLEPAVCCLPFCASFPLALAARAFRAPARAPRRPPSGPPPPT